MFGQYRKGDANDPEIYVATIATVLAQYPIETIRHVTDPRTGIASNPKNDWTGMPNPGDVRRACEDHYYPTRLALEIAAREQQTLRERARLEGPKPENKRTYEELIQSCIDAGLDMPGQRKAAVLDVDKFIQDAGITREQWDAIPNARNG